MWVDTIQAVTRMLLIDYQVAQELYEHNVCCAITQYLFNQCSFNLSYHTKQHSFKQAGWSGDSEHLLFKRTVLRFFTRNVQGHIFAIFSSMWFAREKKDQWIRKTFSFAAQWVKDWSASKRAPFICCNVGWRTDYELNPTNDIHQI